LVFIIIRYTIIFIFIIFNVILLIFIVKHKIASSCATILIRTETCFDILALLCLVLTLFQEQPSFPSTSISYVRFYCYFIFGNQFFYAIMTISIYLTVSLSIDRFICIVFPLYYKRKNFNSAYFYVLASIVCGLIFGFLNFSFIKIYSSRMNGTHRHLRNYSCPPSKTVINSIIYIFTYSLGPVILIVILNVISIKCLLSSLKNPQNSSIFSISFTRKKMIKRYTLAVFIANSTYAIILTIDIIIYLLYTLDVVLPIYKKYFYYCQYFTCCLTVINPLVYLILFKNFRGFIFTFWISLRSRKTSKVFTI